MNREQYIQKYRSCFKMVNFNIDKCLKDIHVPDEWKWIPLEDRIIPWVNLLVNEDEQKYALVCLPSSNEKYIMNIDCRPYKSDGSFFYRVEILSLPRLIKVDILNCEKNFFILPILLNIYDIMGILVDKHQNVLIFNNITKTVERFEPHGSTNLIFEDNSLDSLIDRTISTFVSYGFSDYTYAPPTTFCPYLGPQLSEVEARKHGYTRDGFCLAFALLYIHLRLSHPNTQRSLIIEIMMKGGSLLTYNRVLKFAYLVSLVDPWSISQFKPKYLEIPMTLKEISHKIIDIIDRNMEETPIDLIYSDISLSVEAEMNGLILGILHNDKYMKLEGMIINEKYMIMIEFKLPTKHESVASFLGGHYDVNVYGDIWK